MLFDQWQIVGAPAGDAASQASDILVAGSFQFLGAGAGVLARGAYQQQRLAFVLVQLGHAAFQSVVRNVDRIDDVAGAEVLLRAQVNDDRLLTVDQGGGLRGGQRLARLAAFGEQQQGEDDKKGGGQQVVIADEFDQMLKKLH